MPLGVPELLLILVILLIIFGAKRLPQLGRQLGGGMREFKDSVQGRHGDDDDDDASSRPELVAGPQTSAPDASRPAAADEKDEQRSADQ